MFLISSVPIYKKVYDEILKNILNGNYEIGSSLPSEAELEEIFEVSRTPIRQALKQLESDGYITRSKGKKSVVKSMYPASGWSVMTGLRHNYEKEEWKRITAETLEIKKVTHKKYAKELGLYLNPEIIYLKRLRYFNNQPVVYIEHYINSIVPLKAFKENLRSLTVFEILRKESNIKIAKAREEMEAIAANNEIAAYLNVDVNTPLLRVKRTSCTEDRQPIDINIYYVRTDLWKYEVSYNL